MVGGLTINGDDLGMLYTKPINLDAGGVAFFEGGGSGKPEVIEQMVFLNAVRGKGELTVLPEQAYTVTLILEAIYESAKTGKLVHF